MRRPAPCRSVRPLVRHAARWRARRALLAGLALVGLAGLPSPLAAQYFGRNKVQYDRFDFRIIRTPHFDVHYYPVMATKAADAARMAERWYERHHTTMHHEFDRRSIIFYADPPDFQQTNVVSGLLGQGTGGVTEGLRERVIMPFTPTYAETDHVLGHEIVHVFQYDIAATTQRAGLQSLNNVPLWMIEGMAEYLSVGRVDPHTAMWLRDALRRDDLPTVDQLTNDPRYFPYRFGQALWAYVGGRWSDDAVEQVFRASLRLGYQDGIETVLGVDADTLSQRWHAEIRRVYAPLIAGRSAPDSVGRNVVGQGRREGEQNISPSVSPDGRLMAFYSSRGLFGFNLLLADTRTGRVVRELATITSSDADFDQIAFINSAGSWSPDGRHLAFVVYAEGDNEIVILDVQSRDIVRRVRPRDVGAVNDPAFSPDGRQLLFSGMKGGISDLYVMDLSTGAVRQLTEGRNAEIQPQWSPDGRTIVFVTDRDPATDFQRLTYAPLRLALLDVASGDVRLLPRLGEGKHINPWFSPDGQDLFFISDADGFSDIYRLHLADSSLYRITRLVTGVSGITATSPAMSVARADGSLYFSTFNDAGYAIRALSAAELRGEPVTPGQVLATLGDSGRGAQGATPGTVRSLAQVPVGAVLPPPDALATSIVTRYLNNPDVGLVSGTDFESRPFRSRLQLDYVGVPSAGVAYDNVFGAGFYGGVAALFNDQLNNHTVQAIVQANGQVEDIGGQVAYFNRERRWNWGAGAQHIPYLSYFSSLSPVTIDVGGGTVQGFESNLDLIRQFNTQVFGIVQYPFSATRRVEFQLSAQRIGYSIERVQDLVVGNTIVDRRRFDLDAPDPIYLGRAGAALVWDNSFFGFVSPVAGGRYRIEYAPAIGTLNFQTVTLDYRRYFFPQPVTFAVRGLLFGRFGPDAEAPEFAPLYLGYPSIIRGYDVNNFEPTECTAVTNNSCPEYTRLLGSRIGVASAELRLPLIGTSDFGLINIPFLPTELSLFTDAGVAWTKDESPQFEWSRHSTERIPVVSSGVSARINLLGFAVVEIFYAYPWQRPEKGAHFGWQIAPGW